MISNLTNIFQGGWHHQLVDRATPFLAAKWDMVFIEQLHMTESWLSWRKNFSVVEVYHQVPVFQIMGKFKF